MCGSRQDVLSKNFAGWRWRMDLLRRVEKAGNQGISKSQLTRGMEYPRTDHVRRVVTASNTTSSAFFKASASSGLPIAGFQSLHSSSLTTKKLHTSTFRYTPNAYIAEVSMS